jgi:hypothetical protein
MRIVKAIVFLITLLVGFRTEAQTFQTTGNWNTGTNWSTGSVPSGTSTDVSVQNNKNPTLSAGANNTIGNISIGTGVNFTVSSGATLTLGSSAQFNATPTQDKRSMTITNSATLNVNTGGSGDGLLEIWGDLIVGTSLQMNIRGNLIIHGNFQMANSGQVTVTGGGTITVLGNFTGGTGAQLTVSGGGSTISVTGALALGNSSQITTSGGGTISASSCTCSGCSAQCGVVPITLSSFEVYPFKDKILLNWTTSSELNFDYFSVERSTDGLIFSEISQIKGHGTTKEEHHYSYDDQSPFVGRSYYRLTSNDFDGYKEQFPAAFVEYRGEKKFEVSPNPSKGNSLSFQLNFSTESIGTLVILDNLGVEIDSYKIPASQGNINFTSSLKDGVYYAKFSSQGFSKVTRFIVKN